MSKQINVHFDQENQRLIIDSTDVQKGDYIELTNLTNFESYLKDQAINAYKDEIIKQYKDSSEFNQLQEKLDQLKARLNDQENQFNSKIKDLENNKQFEINKLENQAKVQASEYKSQIDLLNMQVANTAKDAVNNFKSSAEFINLTQKINDLSVQNQALNQQLSSAKENAINSFKSSAEYINLCSERDQLLKDLKYASDKANNELKFQLEIQERDLTNKFEIQKNGIIDQYRADLQTKDLQIQSLNENINELKMSRFMLGTKAIGEDFENSCASEYARTMGQVADDCVFRKANEVIKNTKPDFIFEVYPSIELAQEARMIETNPIKKKNSQPEWLWKAVLEMKSEGIATDDKNKHKNADFLNKLEKDRINNNANLAILVTELEKEDNFLIKKDPAYPNIIIARPSAMVPILQMIRMIALKFKNENLENIEFREKSEINREFEELKLEILNNSIANINKNLESILSEVIKLRKSADNIEDAARIILNTHLNTVRNKIENFKIKKILKDMDKLETSSVNHSGLIGTRIELDDEDIKSERVKAKIE